MLYKENENFLFRSNNYLLLKKMILLLGKEYSIEQDSSDGEDFPLEFLNRQMK